VGTGKTTLARAILGGVTADRGSIYISTKHTGCCAQKPLLIDSGIKMTVCSRENDTETHQEWYETVIRACGLEEDIKQLAGGIWE